MTLTVATPSAIHDFDFIHGRWTVEHRRLKARGLGANEWDSFPSTSYCEPRLGGLANVEEVDCPARGWTGLAFRLFDIETQEWTVRWVNSTNGVLQPPVRGRFHAGGCVLEGPDTDEGRPIIARYIWSDITPGSARWTQAFSYDDGTTWEINWVMDFTRVAA
ncbi:MAG: DUF1579 domain-containing protein [Brevundimonas sp.]|uniref:DUF1579 domain-containing protein n=1 Tax=Brevundimonas sp. TaxID=1871086 RepID=UPI002AB95EC5|nr:DUF1579 domain-containing protein [Brevundimonas sp.]MDZ4112263.1 DUF1579 domain-containing protein [Brevundimonas sp.]